MFSGSKPHGFTIVETMIVLAVTAGIAVSVFTLLSGQINKTQYNSGIRQFSSQLQTVATDVENGYYKNVDNSGCSAPLNAYPDTNNNTNSQGSNYGCTFIGHVLQFNPTGTLTPLVNANNNKVIIDYTIVGRQYGASNSNLVTDLTDAKPRLIGTKSKPTLEAKTIVLPPGLYIKDVSFDNVGNDMFPNPGSNEHYDSLVGFFSSFSGAGGTQSTGTQDNLIPIPSNSTMGAYRDGYDTSMPTNNTGNEFISESDVFCSVAQMLNDPSSSLTQVTARMGSTTVFTSPSTHDKCNKHPAATMINPPGGVQVCVASDSLSNYFGIISIGGDKNNNQSNPLNVSSKTYYDSTSKGCPPQ
jgi:type II secretory pathway pseudopilin PulG